MDQELTLVEVEQSREKTKSQKEELEELLIKQGFGHGKSNHKQVVKK